MKTVTIKGSLVCFHWHWMGPTESHWSYEPGSPRKIGGDCIAVIPHDLTVEVPEINIIAGQIEALEAEKAKAAAEFGATVMRINERLSKLQAITNEVTAHE